MASVSKSKQKQVFADTGGRCWYCGCELHPDHFHVDHQIPKSSGGSSDIDNLVASCERCNMVKGTLSIEEFRIRMKYMPAVLPSRVATYLAIAGIELRVPESLAFYGERS